MLLPVGLLLRRADTVAVIGAALSAKAKGAGYRRIAEALARPAERVRGWLRRFGSRAEAVRRVFTVLLRAVAADPVIPGPGGSRWADAVVAIGAAAVAVAVRFAVFAVPLWQWVSAASRGRLLAPGWPGVVDQHELTLARRWLDL